MDPTFESQGHAFRIIVVGAGLSGLTLSNALQRSGINHVVLEKHRDICHPCGATIALWPHVNPLLQQFGCLESIRTAGSDLYSVCARDSNGEEVYTVKLFDELAKRYFYSPLCPGLNLIHSESLYNFKVHTIS